MKVSRRQFISWGLAAGATLGVQGAGHAFFGHVMRTSSRMDSPVPTICRACPAGCGIVGYQREIATDKKRLIAIMGNPEHPTSRGKLCALAMASINLHYHPERLLSAKRRSGQDVPIAKAIAEAAQTIKRLVDDGARVVIDTWDEQPAQGMLLEALNGRGKLIGREYLDGFNRAEIMKEVWGAEVRPDFDHSDLLLVFGDNPLEHGPRFIQDARRIMEARAERGMRMIVFDPRLSNTGGRADLWVPVRPGTEGVAALAVARHALEHKSLDGVVELRGGYISNLSLAKALDGFDPASSAAICGVDAELLIEAGRMFAEAKRPATMTGDGVFDYPSGLSAYHSIALLDAMGGIQQVPVMPRPRMATIKHALSPLAVENFYRTLEHDQLDKVVLISHRANPAYDRGVDTERALRSGKLAYHLAITPFANETSATADLTIPEALPIECDGRVWLTAYTSTPTYVLQQPIIASPLDVPSASAIFAELAAAFEGGEMPEDFDLDQVRRTTGANLFTEIGEGIFAGDRPYAPTIRCRVSLTDLEAVSIPAEAPLRKDELFLVMHDSAVTSRDSAKCKWLAEIQHCSPLFVNPEDARRLRVRDGDEVLLISRPDDPGRNATRVTAMVEIFVSDGVRPGVAAMVKGQGHTGEGKLAKAERFKSEIDPDTKLLWWEDEGNGTNLSPFFEPTIDEELEMTIRPVARLRVWEG